MSKATITIPISIKEKERLSAIAMRYGLSLPILASKILQEISSDITEDSWDDYTEPNKLKSSVSRSLADYRKGSFHECLWTNMRRRTSHITHYFTNMVCV